MTDLVDANVLSEPTKPSPNAKVVDWLRQNEAELVVTRNSRDFREAAVKVFDPFA